MLRSLLLASLVAAQGRAQPGRGLLPALLHRLSALVPPSLVLHLLLRLLPRSLYALSYLSHNVFYYLLLRVSLGPSLPRQALSQLCVRTNW